MTDTQTPRLNMEVLRPSHAAELFAPFQPAELYRYIPEQAPATLADLQRGYREFAAGAPADSGELWLNWAVRERSSRQCIGTLQATVFADGLLWVGYKFAPAHWGQGYASEALRWLLSELARRLPGRVILAAADHRHQASIRVLQKAGFRFLRREAAELHGEASQDDIYRYQAAAREADHVQAASAAGSR